MEKGKNKYGCRNASEKSCERKMCASGGEKEGKGKLCVALSRFPCGFAKVLRLLLCVCVRGSSFDELYVSRTRRKRKFSSVLDEMRKEIMARFQLDVFRFEQFACKR